MSPITANSWITFACDDLNVKVSVCAESIIVEYTAHFAYFKTLTEFMSYSKCLSDENLIRNATRCTESHRKRLLYIAQYVSDDLRIAAACCSLHLRHSCFNSLITDKCDRQAQRFVLDQTEGPYRSLISNVCSPYFMSGKGAP